ncbi:MAG TPA: hypothetical protein VLJ10_02270 [Candidatus Bathyarchaeia archaeon]|nr:hypothetical protein [Candidatus Bathyarchaeia archaeon]
MNDIELKENTFEAIREMELNGWEVISLSPYHTVIKAGQKDTKDTVWSAILIRNGITVYLEIESKKRIWMSDIKRWCPKCQRSYWPLQEVSDLDFCPDCETPLTYMKDINEDYHGIVDLGDRGADLPDVISSNLNRLHMLKSQIEIVERVQFDMLERIKTLSTRKD